MKYEEYIDVADHLKEALNKIQTIEWRSPKKHIINKRKEKVLKHFSHIRDQLEEIMYFECPDEANTHVFYGWNKKEG